MLNNDSDPHMTDPRVSALHYEQLRPLHPGRLSELLMYRFESGEFGQLIRSAGFCQLATRPEMTLQWDHVRRTISFHLASAWDVGSTTNRTGASTHTDTASDPGGLELLAIGEDLAFIGLDLDHDRLVPALDEVALSDDELAAGPGAWRHYPDPFPSHETAAD